MSEMSEHTRKRLQKRYILGTSLLDEMDRPQAERLRDAISTLGLSQGEFAHIMGMTRQTVCIALNADYHLDRMEKKLRNLSYEELPGT